MTGYFNNRPITLDPEAFASHVRGDLKTVLPDTETIKKLPNNSVEQFRAEIEGGIKTDL